MCNILAFSSLLWGCLAGGFGIVHLPPQELDDLSQIHFAITTPTGDCSQLAGRVYLNYILAGDDAVRLPLQRVSENQREVRFQLMNAPLIRSHRSGSLVKYAFEYEFDGVSYRYPRKGLMEVPLR